MKRIENIVNQVRDGSISDLITDVVPEIKDIFSAKIILDNSSSLDVLEKNFTSTFSWLKKLQEKEDWEKILQDFLFMVWSRS